jgi:hypothetical protein
MTISYKGFMRERIQKHPVTISPDASESGGLFNSIACVTS